jgi:hypothetical protein
LDKVTVCGLLVVPTACEPKVSEEGDKLTLGCPVTFTVVVPDLVASWVDVAVTVTFPAASGAVNRPDELIVPALALQVTVEL